MMNLDRYESDSDYPTALVSTCNWRFGRRLTNYFVFSDYVHKPEVLTQYIYRFSSIMNGNIQQIHGISDLEPLYLTCLQYQLSVALYNLKIN